MMSKYQWQGELVKVEFGNCIVRENKENPLCWYNYECHPNANGLACIPAIKITTKDGDSFMLANHFGIGIHKLRNGGWPNYRHFSLDGKFSTKPRLKYTEFNLEGFERYEAERNKWQQKNYPEEWKKLQAIRSAFNRQLGNNSFLKG
jgi:hypothetical protein